MDPVATNPLVALKNAAVRNKTKILITTNVVTVGLCLLMKSGISQHNAFLKEHGLFDQFYNIASDQEV